MERRSPSVDKLSEVVVGGFWSFLSSATSAMPNNANTACAAATERLNRVVAGLSVVGALERAVKFERRADGLGRILERTVESSSLVVGGFSFGLHRKGLFSLIGPQMVSAVLRGVPLNRELFGGRGFGLSKQRKPLR